MKTARLIEIGVILSKKEEYIKALKKNKEFFYDSEAFAVLCKNILDNWNNSSEETLKKPENHGYITEYMNSEEKLVLEAIENWKKMITSNPAPPTKLVKIIDNVYTYPHYIIQDGVLDLKAVIFSYEDGKFQDIGEIITFDRINMCNFNENLSTEEIYEKIFNDYNKEHLTLILEDPNDDTYKVYGIGSNCYSGDIAKDFNVTI